jgi:hypothetical protein
MLLIYGTGLIRYEAAEQRTAGVPWLAQHDMKNKVQECQSLAPEEVDALPE